VFASANEALSDDTISSDFLHFSLIRHLICLDYMRNADAFPVMNLKRIPMERKRYPMPVQSVELSKRTVQDAVAKLPESLRGQAKEWLFAKLPRRYGSDLFARRNPKLAVTKSQRKLMWQLYRAGMSFREIEALFRLKMGSGNGAQRCIKKYEDETGHPVSPSSSASCGSRMAVIVSKLAEKLAVQYPAYAPAKFRQIIALLKPRKASKSGERKAVLSS
jgi:hypothetical protein